MRRKAATVPLGLLVACAAPTEAGDLGEADTTSSGVEVESDATDDGSDSRPDPGDGDGASTTGGPDDDDGTAPPPGGSSTGEPSGSEDGSSTGAPADPGLGCEGRTDLLVCDDFEGDAIDGAIWTILDDNGATIVVDDVLPFHGGRSLHLHLPLADGAHAGVRTSLPFPVTDNHFFGRAMFFVSPEAPQTHSALLAARGDLDGAVAQYRLDSNGGELNSRYTHTPTVEQHGGLKKFGYDVPVAQWLCIEWEYDGEHDTMRYWMDGDEVESMTVTADSEPQPWVAPIFADFEVGFRTYQAGSSAGGYDVYWDAVALATFRIGCAE